MRNTFSCGALPEKRIDRRADAAILPYLVETSMPWPEVPTTTIRGNLVDGSDQNRFSLRTMIMMTVVSVLLAAVGTATTMCTLEDCHHIFSAHAQRSPSDVKWDRGGLGNPSPSKTVSVGDGPFSTPGMSSLTSPMSPRNPNAVEASLFAGIKPSQANAGTSSSVDDSTTWQVVHNDFLAVRSNSCLYCKVIGMKDRCIMVSGRREGDWIRLLYEPGYMLAVANGSALLQKSEVSYSKITRGTCAEHGLYPITDDISCEAAALAIGFPDLAVQVMHDTGRPEGCYMLGFTLWMSVNPQNKGHGVTGHRQPLCSSRPTPVADPCQKITTHNRSSPLLAAPTHKQERSSHSGRHTLFCFSLIQPDTYELKLMTVQLENSASIFSCDGSAVLSVGRQLNVGPRWRTILVPSSNAPQNIKPGQDTVTAQLSMTSMRAWDLLMQKGTLWSYTWTAKVDSSAVFFPNRLLRHLGSFLHINEPGERLFTQSCDSRQGPSGAIAIYSKEALRTYQSGNARCGVLAWHHWSNAYFMQKCFQMLGLHSKQDMDATKSIFGTDTCHPNSCRDRSQVSFKGFKKASNYMLCFEQANEGDTKGLWKMDTVDT